MPDPHSITHDVLIAGAGPVGLFLACELRLAGVSVLVLEKAVDGRSLLKGLPFGLRGLSAPTLEAFYRRGLLDDVLVAQRANDAQGAMRAAAHWTQQQRKPAGHFAGIQFFRNNVDSAKWSYRLPSPAGVNAGVDMQSLESILFAKAIGMGAEFRRGAGVEQFDQADDGIVVDAGGQTYCSRWLVGCDGGRSTVRKLAGFDFVGTEPEFTGYSVDIDLVDPGALEPGRHYTATGSYTFAKPGTIAMVDFDGGRAHRAEPVTLDQAQTVLRRASGVEVTLTALRLAATWTDRAFQATAYRRGRVLLAGDAAHIHSPLGGQGLNLGLGDAMNLGWKLGATIRGAAPAGLLDSYFAERHPVGARILDWSRAQVALMRPSPSSRALAAIVRDLMETREGATYFAERVSGVSLRYNLGGSHPLVGRSVPDFEFADGTRAGQCLRGGKGLLLDFTSDAQLRAPADRWRERVDYVAGGAKDQLGLSAVLVRPDGIVAWAGEDNDDSDGLIDAASIWFGPSERPE